MNGYRAAVLIWSALAVAFCLGAVIGYGSEVIDWGYRSRSVFWFVCALVGAVSHGVALGWAVYWPEEPESE